MMRVILVVVLIIAAAVLIYRHFQEPPSDEMGMVKALEARFDAAVARFAGNGQAGILPEMSVEDSEEVAATVKKIRDEFRELKPTLTEAKVIARAEQLRVRIDEFCKTNDIN